MDNLNGGEGTLNTGTGLPVDPDSIAFEEELLNIFNEADATIKEEVSPKIFRSFENLFVHHFTFTALHSADKFSNEKGITGLSFKVHDNTQLYFSQEKLLKTEDLKFHAG